MITLRRATIQDIGELTRLMSELGYPTNEKDVRERMQTILHHPDYCTVLAITPDNQAAGMVGMIKNYHYEHNGCYVRIAALVVKSHFRKAGIGTLLMQQAEVWAKELGANAVLLNSGNRDERIAAHAFYKSMGFEIKSSGFVKWLH